MEHVRDLLNRIRWDREFGAGRFELGVYDRIRDAVDRVPFAAVHFEEGNAFAFSLRDAEGELRTIPLHRVREVYKDGRLIWKR